MTARRPTLRQYPIAGSPGAPNTGFSFRDCQFYSAKLREVYGVERAKEIARPLVESSMDERGRVDYSRLAKMMQEAARKTE